jgi:endonuclease/exonuclease/phosphatase family metal-dependent hydrolase
MGCNTSSRIIRVATINILVDLSLWHERKGLLASGLAVLAPDLIALQEIHIPEKNALWLARQTGHEHIFIQPKLGKESHQEGIAILSRLPFENQEWLDLEGQERVAQRTTVQIGGKYVEFYNTHFSCGEDYLFQLAQVERLLNWARDNHQNTAQIICGDFNATPESAPIKRMEKKYQSAFQAVHSTEPEYTFPTGLPTIWKKESDWIGTIDYIFVNQNIQTMACQIILNTPATTNNSLFPSDHFGLMADLEFE